MPKKKKIQASRQDKAAGNSRLDVSGDAYRPFEDIKSVKVRVIRKESKPAPKPGVPARKDPIVLGYDPKANFGDILKSWETTGELTGVTKRMKSYSKVEVSKSFGEILAEWEGAGKKQEQAKETEPIKKSQEYKPTKDFGALLDAFEGKQTPKDRSVKETRVAVKQVAKTPLAPTAEIEEALEEKDELDEQQPNSVSWSFADTYRKWNQISDEDEAIKRLRKQEEVRFQSMTINELRDLEPQATLDLHGLTVLEAEKACADFLRAAKDKHLVKVAIITGKGLHNDKGYSVLRDAALSQIRLSRVVREAYTPKAIFGGSGVIWVILKTGSQ